MKRFLFLFFMATLLYSAKASVTRTTNGFIAHASGIDISVTFYSPSIVRITKSIVNGPKPAKGYSVIMLPQKIDGLSFNESGDSATISTEILAVSYNELNGKILFKAKNAAKNTSPLLFSDLAVSITPRTDNANKGKFKVTNTFLLDKDEAIYGLGQLRDTCMNQRGRHIEIWNHNTYISIPFFTSEKGYGVYWDNPGKSYFDDNDKGTSFTSEVASSADYYFIYKDGSQDGVIAGIRQLTGQATMFPLWAMGFFQSRERYKTSDELAGTLDRYHELHIPIDVMVQDWQYWGCDSNWNAMKFMNPYYINKVGDPKWSKYLPGDLRNKKPQTPRLKSPQEMVDYVHSHNAYLMISIWPNFGPWTEQYKELKNIGALYPFTTWPRNAGVLIYDAFNPKARDIYWKNLTNLYNMGFDAWWSDATEPDQVEKPGDDDWMTHDGSFLSVKNAYPIVHNRAIYEYQRNMKGNKKRSVQLTRSASFGIQHYGTASWSGDIQASWSEMKAQVPSGLNFSLCGIPFWNTDIGGFFYGQYNNDPKNPAMLELKTRWMQWGTFLPIMRNHCSGPMLSELYSLGKPGDWAYDAMLDAIKLRYRLLPYIYSAAGECTQHNGSIMRPLVMDFKDDHKASRLNNEYMFGHSLLVKPVTDPMYTWKDSKNNGHLIYPDVKKAAAPISVYLPKGTRWFDFWSNKSYDGGRNITMPCPIDIMPVFVKAGTVMPFGPEVQYSNEKKWDNLEIRVYPGADASFTLYEDEGDNYNYERGRFSEITFSWKEDAHTLFVSQRRGSFTGMLQNRTFNIVLVGADSGKGSEPMKVSKTITYNGNALSIKL